MLTGSFTSGCFKHKIQSSTFFNLFHGLSGVKQLNVCILAITCPGLSEGVNTVSLTANEIDGLSYLESYTYSCIEGYATTDPVTTLCQPDGSLSVTNPPNCTGRSIIK